MNPSSGPLRPQMCDRQNIPPPHKNSPHHYPPRRIEYERERGVRGLGQILRQNYRCLSADADHVPVMEAPNAPWYLRRHLWRAKISAETDTSLTPWPARSSHPSFQQGGEVSWEAVGADGPVSRHRVGSGLLKETRYVVRTVRRQREPPSTAEDGGGEEKGANVGCFKQLLAACSLQRDAGSKHRHLNSLANVISSRAKTFHGRGIFSHYNLFRARQLGPGSSLNHWESRRPFKEWPYDTRTPQKEDQF
ncbi:hypothetical protein B0H17DRAFT_1142706 [Mycena rosella]|uniref:Uncharacterized protein n=1 Tax=Mycena rosella TaxID=1033263 RepID=A0AAD7G596_MYCRO|nr:hypothetical protein B0H17DRAFT_1142706 [Mycena rosella]